MAVRCLIVDDNRVFLRAASRLLERDGITVVGVASTAAEARQRCTELQPDVALVDIDLGRESGFELCWQLAAGTGERGTNVILISAHSGDDFAELIAASPALSFLGKSDLSGTAIRDILAGQTGEDTG